MATKMTVQFNLFGGTVLKIGTKRHHDVLLKGIDSLEDIGCFGLTELGYGNNAVQMETTAVYDSKTDELIVNTPNPLAQKYWITNGALHAHHIVVFSQLIVDGVNEGIHGVLVPIRFEIWEKRLFSNGCSNVRATIVTCRVSMSFDFFWRWSFFENENRAIVIDGYFDDILRCGIPSMRVCPSVMPF